MHMRALALSVYVSKGVLIVGEEDQVVHHVAGEPYIKGRSFGAQGDVLRRPVFRGRPIFAPSVRARAIAFGHSLAARSFPLAT